MPTTIIPGNDITRSEADKYGVNQIPSRERSFELEFRWLESVQSQAESARIPWIAQLARELRDKIPAFIKVLESEDLKNVADKAE